jgi:hypothetical protein
MRGVTITRGVRIAAIAASTLKNKPRTPPEVVGVI